MKEFKINKFLNIFRFELSHGTDETQKDVRTRCIQAEPRHGEEWCKISKDVKNWKLKTEEILIKCSQALSIPN